MKLCFSEKFFSFTNTECDSNRSMCGKKVSTITLLAKIETCDNKNENLLILILILDIKYVKCIKYIYLPYRQIYFYMLYLILEQCCPLQFQ
jgi:hypothetical protein